MHVIECLEPYTLLYSNDAFLWVYKIAALHNSLNKCLIQYCLQLNLKRTERLMTDLQWSCYHDCYSQWTVLKLIAKRDDITSRLRVIWMRSRSLTDVPSDRRVNEYLKYKICGNIVHSVIFYGLECGKSVLSGMAFSSTFQRSNENGGSLMGWFELLSELRNVRHSL